LIGSIAFFTLVGLVILSRAFSLRTQKRSLSVALTPPTTEPATGFPTTSSTTTPTLIFVPTTEPIQTVGTEFVGVNAILTKVLKSGGVVTVNFEIKASENSKLLQGEKMGWCTGDYTIESAGTKICNPCDYPPPLNRPDCFEEVVDTDGAYSLESAFIVDESNQMKYEVLKDASGKYLSSTIQPTVLKAGQSISLYAQFTAPPETCKTITINFPKVQPFAGISLEQR